MSRINGVIGVVRPVVRGLTSNKGVGVPPGYQLLKGADGAYLKGADGAYLYGVAV